MNWLPQERLSNAIGNIAQAAQIRDETLEYVKERMAFGQPISSFQYNKFLLAELVTKIEVTRGYVDNAVLAHSKRELSPIDAAKIKWWCADVQNDVLDACVQLYGLRLHERVPGCPRLARRPGLQDLGWLQRDHEGAHRS